MPSTQRVPGGFFFFFLLYFSVRFSDADAQALTRLFPPWVLRFLPQLLLGFQVLFELLQPRIRGTCLPGPQIQGSVPLTLVEFSEFFSAPPPPALEGERVRMCTHAREGGAEETRPQGGSMLT